MISVMVDFGDIEILLILIYTWYHDILSTWYHVLTGNKIHLANCRFDSDDINSSFVPSIFNAIHYNIAQCLLRYCRNINVNIYCDIKTIKIVYLIYFFNFVLFWSKKISAVIKFCFIYNLCNFYEGILEILQ